jgi:hypothetical protein
MAAIESKGKRRKKANGNWQLAISQSKTEDKTKNALSHKHLALGQSKNQSNTNHSKTQTAGKTTTRRSRWGRNFYRFQGLKGKVVDFAEFYTVGDFHSIDLRFSDKTMLHFVIEPGFTLETEYSSVKTGNWRCIKRWPVIRSAPLNS